MQMLTGIAAKIIRLSHKVPDTWDGPYVMEQADCSKGCVPHVFFTSFDHVLSIYEDGRVVDQFWSADGHLITHPWQG